MGEIIGSVGEDGKFKVWEEDVGENPHSGRRFKMIYSHFSPTRVPFMSLDFKYIYAETYVALATRDGYLMVCEPVDQDDLTDWHFPFANYIRATPSRQDEASFRVAFHGETLPCWAAMEAGLDRKALSLAVAAMDTVKVFRTDKERQFYQVAELTGARDIIRDVAWANGSMRGFDIIAAAGKDGITRVYELTTVKPASAGGDFMSSLNEIPSSPRGRGARQQPSALGAELAGASRSIPPFPEEDARPGRIKHQAKMVAELNHGHGAVWRINFSMLGE